MLPDNFPVFHIDLDCDFQSSDNVFPPFGLAPPHSKKQSQKTLLSQNETTTIFSTIGQRKDNLDRCVILKRQSFTIMAVFDGHCDPQPVDYLERQLVQRLASHPLLLSNTLQALANVFQELERQVIEKFDKGSTALVSVVYQNELFVANLGDCQLFGVDNCGNVKHFTSSHNLANPQELKEVISRGGIVLKKGNQYRINGQLNLSRCFGDKHLKYCVSNKPDFYRFKIGECKRWVFASDGFYNSQNLQKSLKLKDLRQLGNMKTVYKDNASAIFLDA